MPTTTPGWILFGALLAAGCATSATATKLIMAAFGRAERDWGDVYAAYIFGALVMIATALFLYAEPSAPR